MLGGGGWGRRVGWGGGVMYNVDTLSHRTKIIAKVELLGIGVCEVERLGLGVCVVERLGLGVCVVERLGLGECGMERLNLEVKNLVKQFTGV